MPTIDEIELAFYERFFFSRDLEPYPVQEQAFERIFAGDSVLVTVPTGTGKTLMAKAAIYKALELGQKAAYTTPLRALTEEKYRELCDDFGADKVGFATGDYKVNRDAPVQVEVAEILWNRIFGDRTTLPADVVIMDEGHYFNDFSRGYVWEQSIIGLDPRTQLVILSATVGRPDRFCHWVELTRQVPLALVESHERRIPLHHEYREEYLIEVVRDLNHKGDVPAIIFVFGRERCFDVARLLKSCRRFTSDEERARVESMCDRVFVDGGVGDELKPLLMHGIGIHHAGILPRYKQLVEELALERLIKFVVSTETIAAGINLPARTVVFPALRKHVRGKSRLVTPAEFHQMSGRAGRPQFDDRGLAICLAPEDIVQDVRKQVKDLKKRGHKVDEERIRKAAYHRARADAQRRRDVTWNAEAHTKLVEGAAAELKSRTRITPEQVLAIGLPNLVESALPGAELVLEEQKRVAAEEARKAEAAAKKAAEEAKKAEEAAKKAEEEARRAAESESASASESESESESASGSESGSLSGSASASGQAPPAKKKSGRGFGSLGTLGSAFSALSNLVAQDDSPDAADGAESASSDGASGGASGSEPAAPAPEKPASHPEGEKPADPAGTEAPAPAPTPERERASEESLPPYMNLNILTVVNNLLMSDGERQYAHKILAQVTNNLRAIGVIDEYGRQVAGWMIKDIQGQDGLFVYYALMNEQFDYDDYREMVEYLVDHDTIQKRLNRKDDDKRREWIRERLREHRREGAQVSWEDIEKEYDREFPRELSRIEEIHQRFAATVPHPELHGGKLYKNVWAQIEDEELYFSEFIDQHNLAHEEGSLFSYLIRVMNFARTLYEITHIPQFESIRRKVRNRLAVIDDRLIEGDWEELAPIRR